MSRRLLLALTTIVIAMAGLPSAQESPVVRSASLRLIRKPVNAVQVSVTNRHNKPITSIGMALGLRSVAFHFTGHQSGAAPVPNSTILSGETRSLLVRVGDDDPATLVATVTSIIFEGGRTEGQAAKLRELADMPRSGGGQRGMPPVPVSANSQAFSDSPVTSVSVESHPVAATDIVALLENLRDVPIRAWSLVEIENTLPPRTVGGQTSCLCDGPGSTNLIRPHEIRDIVRRSAEKYSDASPPMLMLTGVLWEDQKLEGSPDARTELLQARARTNCR